MVEFVLTDKRGIPVDKAVLVEELAAPSVTGVRSPLSGHPSAGLTPQRLARLLRAAEDGDAMAYLELAEDMEEKDLHYLGVLGTRKRQVAQLEITVEAASDEKNDVENADLVRGWLDRDEAESELFDILDAIGKGYSQTEIMWDTSEKQWMPSRLEWRDPRWFEFDRGDGRTPLLRNDQGALVPLAPFKFISHLAATKSGLPIRGGLARAVSWAYLFKNFDIKGWIAFAEVYGQPIRVGKYHQGATAEERAALLRAVANIGRDAAAIIPSAMVMEFVKDTSITGSSDLFEKLANYMDRQISKAVLGQVGTTDAIAGGYAVGKVHDEVRGDIERSDAKQLAATLNRDLVRPIIDLNRGPQKAYPRICIGRRDSVDTEKLSQALERLVPLGLEVEQSVVRDKLGLPDPAPGAVLLRPAANAAPPIAGDPRDPIEKATAAADDHARDAIDDLVDRLDEKAILDPMINEIRALLDQADTLEGAMALLLERYPTISMGNFAGVIAEAMVVGELGGRAEMIDG